MFDRRTLLQSIPFLSAVPWIKADTPAPPAEKQPEPESTSTAPIQISIHFRAENGKELTIPAKTDIISESLLPDNETSVIKYRATVEAWKNPQIAKTHAVAFSVVITGTKLTFRSPLDRWRLMDHSQDITLIGDLYLT